MKYTRITLRIPEPMHERLSEAAAKSSKSMNAEIIGRIQQTFDEEDADSGPKLIATSGLALSGGVCDWDEYLGKMLEKMESMEKALDELRAEDKGKKKG